MKSFVYFGDGKFSQHVGRNERNELRRMDLMFAVDVPTP